MPNGTVALVRPEWLDTYHFSDAVADIGCAMSLAPAPITLDDLPSAWNDLYQRLLALDKTILGSGNHFIDACTDEKGGVHVLVHVGSRMTTKDKIGFRFPDDYLRHSERAVDHHAEIWKVVRESLGGRGDPLHVSHDSVERDGRWLVMRKGVTCSPPGAPILIASSFDDVITVGKARATIHALHDSMCHGTGRRWSRGEGKAVPVQDELLRRRIIIPDELPTARWRLEAPVHYRHSSNILAAVDPYIDISSQLAPVAFMGGF